MKNSFKFYVDEVLPPGDPIWDVASEFFNPVIHDPRATVKFTMLCGFEVSPILMPQMRVGIADLEGRPVEIDYNFEQRTGSYTVRGNSRLVVGSIVAGEIRTQLRPAVTKNEILAQLAENPFGLMIEMFGGSGWIAPDFRAQGKMLAIGGHDEVAEFIPSLCFVAQLLREGRLELDGEGVVKLKGHAFVPALGSWFDDGIIGRDLSLNDCYERIDAWGKHGIVPPSAKPDWRAWGKRLAEFLRFENRLSMLRRSVSNSIPH